MLAVIKLIIRCWAWQVSCIVCPLLQDKSIVYILVLKSHPSAEWMTFLIFLAAPSSVAAIRSMYFSLNYPQSSDLWVFCPCCFFFFVLFLFLCRYTAQEALNFASNF